MKRPLSTLLLVAALVFPSANIAAGEGSAFSKLQALAGEWEGQRSDGVQVRVTYKLSSNDSVVIETIESGDEPAMVTVYHRDGNDLRMTHFCAAQNQPRMKTADPGGDAKKLLFNFVDATNVTENNPGHMYGLEITFSDPDHITQRWTWKENAETQDTTFELTRVR